MYFSDLFFMWYQNFNQDSKWKYDILLVDERNIFQASLSLQKES